MNRISINEPCHENWAAMTPSQQGAFCGKCQIDVIDFSGKSANEVKSILQENVGKHLCGRFKKTQLDDLNAAYLEWDNQSAKVFQSKFLYACLIVFGMTLFSCNTPEEMVMGDPPQADENSPRTEQVDPVVTEEYSNTRGTNKEQKYVEDSPKYLKGKVDYNYIQNQQTDCPIPEDTLEEELMTKGEISFIPEPEYMLGQLIVEPEIETISENSMLTQPEIPADTILFSSQIYPNPTGTITTVVIDVKTSGSYKIELFMLNGQKITDLFSGELNEGKSNHSIDLSVYTSGTYLVKVSSKNQTETYRIIKAD